MEFSVSGTKAEEAIQHAFAVALQAHRERVDVLSMEVERYRQLCREKQSTIESLEEANSRLKSEVDSAQRTVHQITAEKEEMAMEKEQVISHARMLTAQLQKMQNIKSAIVRTIASSDSELDPSIHINLDQPYAVPPQHQHQHQPQQQQSIPRSSFSSSILLPSDLESVTTKAMIQDSSNYLDALQSPAAAARDHQMPSSTSAAVRGLFYSSSQNSSGAMASPLPSSHARSTPGSFSSFPSFVSSYLSSSPAPGGSRQQQEPSSSSQERPYESQQQQKPSSGL